MRKTTYSFKPARVLVMAMLAVQLTLNGFSPVQALSTGSLVGWGNNYWGQASIPSGLTDVVAMAGGEAHSLALKDDGTVVAWGHNGYGQTNIPSGLTDVVAIAAGNFHNLALKGDGTVVGWGANYYGQASIPPGLMNVIAIDGGRNHSLALKSDGTVLAWGDNYFGQTNVPSGLTDVIAIATREQHSLALKRDGTVVAWGDNRYGQTNIPSGLAGVVAIDAGEYHSLALKSDGTVVAWGSNFDGQVSVPAGLTDVVAIAAGNYHTLALKSDGSLVAWGANYSGVSTIPSGLTNVIAIASGKVHSLALVSPNTAPTANSGGPYLGAVNTSISFDGSLSSDPESDPLTYAWDFGDSTSGTSAAPTHSYTAAGVYNVCLIVNDGSLDSAPACTMAVVYDPSAGFVTGGGWIDSPAGAYKADETLAGKATFGFISRYQKGASIPSGTTAFEFDLGGLAFSSQSYGWLVVNQAGTNAQFKGSGLINGAADPNGNAYRFMLWAGDGSPDTFRMRIWWEDAAGEHDVYDNGVAQAIGAGNIVVHTGK
jgi:hypothetical protein